jgi:hypothetical protein
MFDLGISAYFVDTNSARISKLSIDYAWSECIVNSKPSNLPQDWMKHSENHEIVFANREIMLLRHTKPVDAFAPGVKSLPKNLYFPENILK